MGPAIEYRLLGALDVLVDGAPVPITAAKQRIVLAALLLAANRSVSIDDLVRYLWHDQPPTTARATLQNYVMRLRRTLRDPAEGGVLRTRPDGYQLLVAEDALDLGRFTSLVTRAEAAAADGADTRAADLLRDALAQWRGDALSDVPSEALHREVVPVLRERRLFATELGIETQLRLGRHRDLVAELRQLTVRHPLRERFWAQLMTALHRSARQAEALEAYHEISAALAEELGIDPCAELRELHQAILTDAAPPPAPTPAGAAVARPPVPRQLPPPPRSFIGRDAELAALSKGVDSSTGTVLISAIAGAGGIGKTCLALFWAQQNADRFPDGQLFVNLRGFGPSAAPLPVEAAVRGFLDALGVSAPAMPRDVDAMIGLYRSLVADKRMLILLDNAADAEQARSLLPGSATCTVLVTSRDRLGGLVASHGAYPVIVDVLPEPKARALLAGRLGAARLAAEPAAVADLLACCAGLPLALSIVAGRAQEYPDFELAVLAADLRDAATRLSALDEDPTEGVRTILSWSYAALTEAQARAFSLLGLVPTPDIDLPSATALLAQPAEAVRDTLRALERISLLQQRVPGRYRMHDLVALYAREQAGRLPAEVGTAALWRWVGFAVHTAFAADRLLSPERTMVPVAPAPPGVVPLALSDAGAALRWFTEQQQNLLTAQRVAAEHGWLPEVWHLAWNLTTFHQRRGRQHDDLASWRAGAEAAEMLGEPAMRIRAHRMLGSAYTWLGLFPEGQHELRTALAVAEQTGNLLEQAHISNVFSQMAVLQGDPEQALAHSVRQLALCRAADVPQWTARALNGVSWHAVMLGRYEQARSSALAALELAQGTDSRLEADVLDTLGCLAHHTDQHARAVDYFQQALVIYRHIGSSFDEADTLDHLANTYLALGSQQQARTAWWQALTLCQQQQRRNDVDRIRAQLAALDDQPGSNVIQIGHAS